MFAGSIKAWLLSAPPIEVTIQDYMTVSNIIYNVSYGQFENVIDCC